MKSKEEDKMVELILDKIQSFNSQQALSSKSG